MINGTPELIAARREEIINACEQLYRTMDFREVTLKEIGNITSFSRPTIYNYFQTKEEIFLALFEREYILWTEELHHINESLSKTDSEMLAEKIAESLEKRILLLKLLSVNLYDVEGNSRMERLVSFKKAYGRSRVELLNLFNTAYPGITENEVNSLMFVFLPYLHGVYPYAFATDKQIEAMDEAEIEHPSFTVKGMVKSFLVRILPCKK